MYLCRFAAALLLVGCLPDDAPSGLRHTPPGDGPVVRFHLQAGVLPFPNDLLARPDPKTLTGRRLNVSLEVATASEKRLRRAALDLDGFGTFSPITVSFTAPLDRAALDGRGRRYADDPALVIDLTPGPSFGERVPLDLGRGAFPLTLPDTRPRFPLDPRAGEGNLVLETVDEDRDGDGALSPREDTDGDGVLDQPNTVTPGGDPVLDLATFYEGETNTLILRPIIPLRPGHRYAVVLTDGVVGEDGAPVRSPFAFVHHTRQTAALNDLPTALGPHGVSLDRVAFAWVFTTQSATAELGAVREGLNGQGPYAGLEAQYPPDVSIDPLLGADVPEAALLRTDRLVKLVRAITPVVLPDVDAELLAGTYADVAYLVAGRFVTPNLVVESIGRFQLDPTARTDRYTVVGEQVPFWCTVPTPSEAHRPPFPVVVYAHDLGGSRLESLRFAGVLASWGLATCALDLVDHGVAVTEPLRTAILQALGSGDGADPGAPSPFPQVLAGLRAADRDGDGLVEAGSRVFSLDALHSRAQVEQSAVDVMQLIRVLRAFDGTRRWSVAGIDSTVAGDFDGDARVDLGGPMTPIHLTGQGLGGMVAGLVAGLDPGVSSYAPLSAGGGIADIVRRGGLPGMDEAILLPMMGPFIAGFPGTSGFTQVTVIAPGALGGDPAGVPIARLPPLVPGDRVHLTNGRNGLVRQAVVDDAGAFRVAVPVNGPEGVRPVEPEEAPAPDAPPPEGDPLILEVFDVSGQPRNVIDRFEADVTYRGVVHAAGDPLVALVGGWGLGRQTPALRQSLDILQVAFEAGDPVNFVRDLALRTPTLVVATLGDPQVPVSTSLALARSAGLLPPDAPAPGFDVSADAILAEHGVGEGVARVRPLVDPEAIAPAALGLAHTDPPLVIATPDGRSAVRLIPVSAEGAHGVRGPSGAVSGDPWRYVANLLGRFFSTGQPGHATCLYSESAPRDCP